MPTTYAPTRRQVSNRYGNRRGGGGNGLLGIVKFLVFALVLGAIVLTVSMTVMRPVVRTVVLGMAGDSPAMLNLPFVRDMVREDLGDKLTQPASSDPEQVPFTVASGDTATSIGARLEKEELILDRRAFVYLAIQRDLAGDLQAGEFILRRNMTPNEVVTALLAPPPGPQYVDIEFRTGLRAAQMTAKLQVTDGLKLDPQDFYDIVLDPPTSLLADYPWLRTALAGAPEGVRPSLEGFLWPAGYRVLPDTTAEELIRLMLDKFIEVVGEERLDVPEERGLSFYEVLTLASIVEREAQLAEEKPLIAGVYQNRIDRLEGVKTGLLNADPTVIYGADTVNLRAMPFEQFKEYVFWTVPKPAMADVELPEDLARFNSYVIPGLPSWPIATPTVGSIDAALEPDTADKFIYFLAIPDGGGRHVFAKTKKEHDANRKEYGYS
jgi:UPF0755 protein